MATKLDLDKSHWQKLMDDAYDAWQNHNDEAASKSQKIWTYSEFLATLDAKKRQAVLLGNLNYQIGNGGVEQWVDNGYACTAPELLAVLALMGSPRAMELANKLGRFVDDYVNTVEVSKGFANGRYWQYEMAHNEYEYEDDSDEEYASKEARDAADRLSDFFYDEPFHEEFLQEVENFLLR